MARPCFQRISPLLPFANNISIEIILSIQISAVGCGHNRNLKTIGYIADTQLDLHNIVHTSHILTIDKYVMRNGRLEFNIIIERGNTLKPLHRLAVEHRFKELSGAVAAAEKEMIAERPQTALWDGRTSPVEMVQVGIAQQLVENGKSPFFCRKKRKRILSRTDEIKRIVRQCIEF